MSRLFITILLGASALAAHAAPLRIGFMPGPYREAFAAAVAPQLERKGYTIRYVEFSQGVQPNDSVEHGRIDANIFQHSVYLEASNRLQQFDLVSIVHVPTPPMGLYSRRHPRLADVRDAATVAIPADPANAARALRILAAVSWVTIRPGADAATLSERDLSANPKHLRIVPIDAAQAPRSLDDVDLAAIQGNYAVSSGLRLSDALKLEDMTEPYLNVVVVKRSNQDAAFARDIAAAYRSAEFQRVFLSNPQWKGYRLPDYFDVTAAAPAAGARP